MPVFLTIGKCEQKHKIGGKKTTLAGALGNPILINTVEDMVQSPTKKFSTESPTDKTTSGHVTSTPDRKPSLKS